MKIVIADGFQAADYIVSIFKKRGNQLIVINPNPDFAKYVAKTNKVPVYIGEPSKSFVLEQANVRDADIFIALGSRDTDNYVACSLARKVFGVKKCICTVNNPKNVDIYKELGLDFVVSSTYLLAESIKSESSLEDVIHTLSLEDDQIVITEMIVDERCFIANKRLMEINFPKFASIAAIYRKPKVIVPHGAISILPKDKLLIVSSPKDQKAVIEFVRRIK